MRYCFYFFNLLLFIVLSGCSLIGKAPKIKYFTLEPIQESCFNDVQVKGHDYLLSDRIIIKRTPHQIGNLPDVFWITSLQDQLPEVMTVAEAGGSLILEFKDLSLEATNMTVSLKGKAKICKDINCSSVQFNNQQKINNAEAINVVSAIQTGLTELVAGFCLPQQKS